MSYFTIITRCYKRPKMLERLKASLATQTCQQFGHVLIVDDVGVGIQEANRRLAGAPILGEYVYVLDDDNELTDPSFLADLLDIIQQHAPDVIMVKSENGPLGILPAVGVWRRGPIEGQIDMLNFVVSACVFRKHAAAFGKRQRCGDFDFIDEVFGNGYRVHWHDRVVARIQRRSNGEPE
jgi:glycosyltransferase involved in cell wall biosynthesis